MTHPFEGVLPSVAKVELLRCRVGWKEKGFDEMGKGKFELARHSEKIVRVLMRVEDEFYDQAVA